MKLEDLNLGYHYYIIDLSYTCRECHETLYIEEYQNIFKDAWEVLEKGKEYPTCKNPICGSCFQPKPNDVKLLHKRTGIILYINALNLSKTKPHGQPFDNKKNCNVNDTEKLYNYPLSLSYGLSSLSSNPPTLQDKYSPENIKNTYEKAMQQEFKIKKRSREEKVKLILAKIKFLIEDSLEKNNKIKFLYLSKRYNLIKNMIK